MKKIMTDHFDRSPHSTQLIAELYYTCVGYINIERGKYRPARNAKPSNRGSVVPTDIRLKSVQLLISFSSMRIVFLVNFIT